jgi:glycosyltransferase involved in cell wall biosynthesis
MKLSIITPYYNAWDFIINLNDILSPQLNNEVEWIIIDDGCHESKLDDFNAIVIHLPKNSGCAGFPRNYGLDVAKGEYITFIDADDLVSIDFISRILNKIDNSEFDYCLLNWQKIDKSLEVDVTYGRPQWNCSVWGIVYKKENIKNIRFNSKKFAEDYDFNKLALKGKMEKINDKFLYFYNSNENGLSANWKGE